MKVIHYIASIDKSGGGTTEYMRLLSKALKNNISFSIAAGISSNPIAIDGVTITFFDNNFKRWFKLAKEYQKFLENEKPDIVHINGIWTPQNWIFQNTAQKLGIKVILSPHGMLEPWIINHNRFKKKIALFLYQNKAIQKSQLLHATALMEAKNIEELGYKTPICIIPNGIDLSELNSSKIKYGTRKIVFLSRIHPKKGIEILLDAWRNCYTAGWSLEIAGVGDEAYIETLKQNAQDLNNVHFVGAKFGQEKWDFIKSADVMVLPTHSENFGIVVAESLAAGVPVITTKGTPWEDLQTHNCGWWIDLSAKSLENALTKVFSIPIIALEAMGNNGRNLIKDKYDIKAIGNKMVDLYNTI